MRSNRPCPMRCAPTGRSFDTRRRRPTSRHTRPICWRSRPRPSVNVPAIDGAAKAKVLREGSDVIRQIDAFRPVLSEFLLRDAASARSQARDDLQFAAGLMAAALVASVLVLLSTNRAIAIPLRRLERALTMLRGGTSDLPSVDLGGTAEIAAAGYAFADLVDEVRLVEAQAAAIGAGDLLNPILAQPAEMSIGHSLQQSVRALSSMSAQLKSREETAKAVLDTAAARDLDDRR